MRQVQAIVVSLLLTALTCFGNTNYVVITGNNGTLQRVVPTTSSFWRFELQTESEGLFLYSLGITNDAFGTLYFFGTNNPSNPTGTNLVGRYVISVTSANSGIIATDITNSDGTIKVLLTDTFSSSLATLSNTVQSTASVIGGYTPLPAPGSGVPTNFYWLDFGKVNTNGQPLIYATVALTNDSIFMGPTNCSEWGLLSLNAVAKGGNRTIYVPQAFPHFTTNGWFPGGPVYGLVLSNGNEFRLTVQSNVTLSTTWETFGQ